MNDKDENLFVGRIKRQLDDHVEAVDELTIAKLRAARMNALDQKPASIFRWLPVTGIATAAAAVLAVVVWNQNVAELKLQSEFLDPIVASEDVELIEDLEFYAWLDETQSKS